VEAVPPYKWDAQSPCDDWKAHDIVDHMVGNSKLFLSFIGLGLFLSKQSLESLRWRG
jgi:hypothetical protein